MPWGWRPISRARTAVAALALALACPTAGAQDSPPPQSAPGNLGLRAGLDAASPTPDPFASPSPDGTAKPTDPLDSAFDRLIERAQGNAPSDMEDGAQGDAQDSAQGENRKPKPKPKSDALPPLQPYKGARRLGLHGGLPEAGPTDAAPLPAPGPTIAAIPAPLPRRRVPVEENPYDPLGVRVGNLKLTPYVEEDLGWASNPYFAAGPAKASAFETTEVGAGLQSNWSRNDLHGQLKAGYTDYFAAPEASGPYGSGTLDGRYDISRDLSLDGEGRFSLAQEPLSSLGIAANAASALNSITTVAAYGATFGGAQKFGDLTLGLHGAYDRLSYGNDGGGENLTADDYDDWSLKGRARYRLSEAVAPFLELGFDTRRYDGRTDAAGYEGNSNGVTGLIGMTLAYSQKLTGDASVGYGVREYQDPRLPTARAPLINASVIWSATPLTTVTLKAQSAIADAVIAGDSADIARSYSTEVSHALTRQVTLGVSAGYATDNYVGRPQFDSTRTLGLKGEYHLTREVVVKASASRQQFVSSVPNSNYIADVFMLGLRLQR